MYLVFSAEYMARKSPELAHQNVFLSACNGAATHSSQEKTPCADLACAECPGFLVLGAADTRTPSFVQEPQALSLD